MNYRKDTIRLVRSRLDNLIESHLRIEDEILSLAVWFNKDDTKKVHLLENIAIPQYESHKERYEPLEIEHGKNAKGWELDIPLHHVIIYSYPPEKELEYLIKNEDPWIHEFCNNFGVLYFNSNTLSSLILETFNIITEPEDFIKGWYLEKRHLDQMRREKNEIYRWQSSKYHIGILQTSESIDFHKKVGIMHVEINSKWLPSTKEGVHNFVWYKNWLERIPGFFLFEGGKIYKIEGFEVKRLPRTSKKVIQPNKYDEYVEVHLSSLSERLQGQN